MNRFSETNLRECIIFFRIFKRPGSDLPEKIQGRRTGGKKRFFCPCDWTEKICCRILPSLSGYRKQTAEAKGRAEMKFADLHTHTRLCRHASGTPEEYLESAIRKGLTCYGISDHIPCPAGYDADYRMKPEEYDRYREEVLRMKKQAEGTGVEVLYGIEFDFVPGRMEEVRAFLEKEKFDYTIGSIHYIGDLPFDDPDFKEEVKSFGTDRLWEEYTDLLCRFAEEGTFNILAHADLPKVFGFRYSSPDRLCTAMRPAFEICAKRGKMIELNTGGLRKPVKEIYPSKQLLLAAKEAGMRITFGSDAHKPCDIAADFDAALELAKSAGYRSAWTFRGGTERELPFD